jgi:hypothetical protein
MYGTTSNIDCAGPGTMMGSGNVMASRFSTFARYSATDYFSRIRISSRSLR